MKRCAFVVGRNGPASDGLDNLQFAESDAARMRATLSEGAAAFDKVVVAEATHSSATVLSEFEKVAASCGHDDMLLFYFSGHGHNPRGELFLLFPDSDLTRLVSTALPISAIKAVMAQSRARVRILVLDCCYSGAAGRETMRSTNRPEQLPLVEAARDCASIIIAACGRNVVTREDSAFAGGYLTHLLQRALTGDAHDADIDQDGLLSVTDFVEWASRETTRLNTARRRRPDARLEAPEIYGDFRSQVDLTANHFLVRDSELEEEVLEMVEVIREVFRTHGRIDRLYLKNLARPIRSLAPTFTNLRVLDRLFMRHDDAAIFAAATILQIRRDPRYMSQLIGFVNDARLRGAANWRVLRAIRDTIKRYEFTALGLRDFVSRLRDAAKQRDGVDRPRFARGTCLSMIMQILSRVKVAPTEVFTKGQLAELSGKHRKPRRHTPARRIISK